MLGRVTMHTWHPVCSRCGKYQCWYSATIAGSYPVSYQYHHGQLWITYRWATGTGSAVDGMPIQLLYTVNTLLVYVYILMDFATIP